MYRSCIVGRLQDQASSSVSAGWGLHGELDRTSASQTFVLCFLLQNASLASWKKTYLPFPSRQLVKLYSWKGHPLHPSLRNLVHLTPPWFASGRLTSSPALLPGSSAEMRDLGRRPSR